MIERVELFKDFIQSKPMEIVKSKHDELSNANDESEFNEFMLALILLVASDKVIGYRIQKAFPEYNNLNTADHLEIDENFLRTLDS